MRTVIQRVSSASVTIDGRVAGQIEHGLLLFVGIEAVDTAADGEWLARKICSLRIFDDPDGKMNLSVSQLPPLLLISQFTLHASTQHRPTVGAFLCGHFHPMRARDT